MLLVIITIFIIIKILIIINFVFILIVKPFPQALTFHSVLPCPRYSSQSGPETNSHPDDNVDNDDHAGDNVDDNNHAEDILHNLVLKNPHADDFVDDNNDAEDDVDKMERDLHGEAWV